MTRIYISHSYEDQALANLITNKLIKLGIDTYIGPEIPQVGSNWSNTLSDSLKKSDVFLVLITENSVNSQSVTSEIEAAKAYVNLLSNEKLFIPIVFDQIKIPLIIQEIQAIIGERNSIDEIVSRIRQAMDSFFGRKVAAEEKREERKLQIETTAANYVEEAIQQLKERENNLGSKANIWNAIGWGSLVSGIVVAVALLILTISGSEGSVMGWPEFAFLSLKSLVIVTLLLASANYAFSLAKSYMIESLKNADRIHAISFGKFFLQMFGDNMGTKEVKEVFQHWNINNTSSFTELDSDNFDPKIVETILSVADVVKKVDSKSKKT